MKKWEKISPLGPRSGYVFFVQELIGIIYGSTRFSDVDASRYWAEIRNYCDVPKEFHSYSLMRRSEFSAVRKLAWELLQRLPVRGRIKRNISAGYPELWTEDGKNPLPWFVSWGHTDHFAVAVVASVPVGIDVERVDRKVESVFDRISLAKERARFANHFIIDNRNIPAPLALWCGKEASAKATGLGMRFGLTCFEILPREKMLYPVRIGGQNSPRRLHDPAVRFHVEGDHLVAICTERTQLLEAGQCLFDSGHPSVLSMTHE